MSKQHSMSLVSCGEVYCSTAQANIALLKYWGKSQENPVWPATSSLSMTLDISCTHTEVRLIEEVTRDLENDVMLVDSQIMGWNSQAVYKRLGKHVAMLREEVGVRFLDRPLVMQTWNTFPAHCGLASSASGFASLTLGVLSFLLQAKSLEDLAGHGLDISRIAELARRGSGSATRSLMGGYVSWYRGASPGQQRVVQEYPREFFPLANTIVILSSQAKKVSSREGHRLASSSLLFGRRVSDNVYRHSMMLQALKQQDFTLLGYLAEIDAFDMHGVMMTSKPPLCYFAHQTTEFVNWLVKLRSQGKLEAYVTLDAGPNVHVLTRIEDRERLTKELKEHQAVFGIERWISDETGASAALKIENRKPKRITL